MYYLLLCNQWILCALYLIIYQSIYPSCPHPFLCCACVALSPPLSSVVYFFGVFGFICCSLPFVIRNLLYQFGICYTLYSQWLQGWRVMAEEWLMEVCRGSYEDILPSQYVETLSSANRYTKCAISKIEFSYSSQPLAQIDAALKDVSTDRWCCFPGRQKDRIHPPLQIISPHRGQG